MAKHPTKKLVLVFLLLFSAGCSDLGGLVDAIGKSVKDNQSGSDGKVVRGPTGGGAGGGVIIVEKNGRALKNTKYEIYFQDGFMKEKLASGYTDSEGKVYLSESELSEKEAEKISSGEANLIVEVYDEDNKKSAAIGRFQPES